MTSGPAIRKPPIIRSEPVEPGPDPLIRRVRNVRDFYVDDVEAVYTAMVGVCDSVRMESYQYENITLDNITDIRHQELTGFQFYGTDPTVDVNMQSHSSVSIAVQAEDDLHRRLFGHLVTLFESRQRRILGIPNDKQFLALIVITLLVLVTYIAIIAFFEPSLWAVAGLGLAVVGLTVLQTRVFGKERRLVVYPIWKRDASPTQGINWREQSVSFVQSLLLLAIGFLLGKYY